MALAEQRILRKYETGHASIRESGGVFERLLDTRGSRTASSNTTAGAGCRRDAAISATPKTTGDSGFSRVTLVRAETPALAPPRPATAAAWHALKNQLVIATSKRVLRKLVVVTDARGDESALEVKVRDLKGARWVNPARLSLTTVIKPSFRLSETAKPNVREEMRLVLATYPNDYPKLTSGAAPYEGLRLSTRRFNCIAHAVHDHDHWIWPGADLSLWNAFAAEHGLLPFAAGYVRNADMQLLDGVEKVTLFSRGEQATHMMRQEADGSWTSKNGAQPLIKLRSPWSLVGPAYGSPFRNYARLRPEATLAQP